MANIPPAATAAIVEGTEGAVQKAVSKLPKKEIKALGSSLLKKFGFTEAKNPEIAAGAIDRLIADNPGIENALKAYKGNTKMQEKVLLDAGIGKDQIAKYLPQAPRVDRQGRLEVPPAVKSTSRTTEEVPFTAPVIVSKAPRPAAAPAATQQQPLVLPPEDLASIETPKALSLKDSVDRWSGYKEPPTEPYIPEPLPGGPSSPQWSAYGQAASGEGVPVPTGPAPKKSLLDSKAFKVGSTVAVGGGAVGTIVALTDTGEPVVVDNATKKPVYKPAVSPSGDIVVGPKEARDYEKTLSGWQIEQKKQEEYARLQDEVDKEIESVYKSTGMTPPPKGSKLYQQEVQKIVDKKYSFTPVDEAAADKTEAVSPTTATEPAEEPAPTTTSGGAETKPAAKPAGTPPLAPEGGAPTGTTQTSAVDKTTLKEPTKEVAKSQQAFPDTITKIINDRKRIADAFGGGKPINRTQVEDTLKNLANVDEEIKTLYANKPPPQLADITRARRDALQAYKEKANLNEWLAIADRAIDAIASFASAQAAKGTPYVGTYKPSSTDYESRTAQALREYQAEAGMLQEERQESEKALAAYEKEKETAAEQMRRGREMAYRIAQEDVKVQEQEQDRVDKTVQDIFSANLSLQKSQQDVETAIQKFRATQAKEDAEAQRKAGKSVLELQIKEQQNAAEVAQKLLNASNELAMNPSDEKAILNYMSLQGKTYEQIQKEIKDDPTWNDAGSVKSIASKSATEAQTILNTSQSRTKELTTQLQSLLSGGTVQPTTPPPGQQPETKVQQFKESDIDKAIAEGKYPGLTKDEVLKKFKDAKYVVLIGQ